VVGVRERQKCVPPRGRREAGDRRILPGHLNG
jgi:hypothetical protein